MNTLINILIVEPDTNEKENFLALAQKENFQVQPAANSYEAIQWLKKNENATIVVIAEDATPLNAYQAFDYIRKELKSELPIVISINPAVDKERPEGYNYIEKPFTEKTLSVVKQLVQPNAPTAKKVYSLEYLQEISGGNQAFLIDCLATFQSSVSEKLKELNTAVNNNDNKNIGAIAHNIKPSFEMLENLEARDICNKLTYETETSDVSKLFHDLNTIFTTIDNALKEDFQELR